MNESGVQVFERSRTVAYLDAVAGVVWAVNALLQLLWFGLTNTFALNLLIAAVWGAGAFVFMRPIARVTSDDISLGLAPIRAMRVIPWSAVQSVSWSRSNVLMLALADGKSVKFPLAQVKKSQRDSLLAELADHVGPIAQAE